jgi:hypothetical protein
MLTLYIYNVSSIQNVKSSTVILLTSRKETFLIFAPLVWKAVWGESSAYGLGEEISLISNPPPKVKGSNPFSPVKEIQNYKQLKQSIIKPVYECFQLCSNVSLKGCLHL